MSTNANLSVSQGTRRRSSLGSARPANIDLILSPNKPPLSEARTTVANEKAETVVKLIESKSKKSRLSELVLLQKSGRNDAIANLKNYEINYLINQILPLVSSQIEQKSITEDLQRQINEINEDLQRQITEGKNMIRTLNREICEFELQVEGLKDEIKMLNNEVVILKKESQKCKECHKSTLELTMKSAELGAVSDLEFRVEEYRLESLLRLNAFDLILSAMTDRLNKVKGAGPNANAEPDLKAAEDNGRIGVDEEAVEAVDATLVAMIEEEVHRERVFHIVETPEKDEEPMPDLEPETQSEDEASSEPPAWMSKVVPQPDVPSSHEVYVAVSTILDSCAFSAVNRSERLNKERARRWGEKNIKDAPMAFAEMSREECDLVDELTKDDKHHNHFSILLTGMQVPKGVKKLETVMKYEREYAIQMAKNIYPQFHHSCIQYIRSLRPESQSWRKPYSLLVTFKSEHVRQHVLAGAAHANLLVRPYMNSKQFEHFRKKQQERYQVRGTSEPGPAFLANGGVVPRQIHPSMEAGFEAWNKEYQRRKQYPKREIVLGGRGRRNMTTVAIDMPAEPAADKYWSNALERAYQKHVGRRSAQMPFNGPLQSVPHGSREEAVASPAETATWPLNWQSQQSFIHTWLANNQPSGQVNLNGWS